MTSIHAPSPMLPLAAVGTPPLIKLINTFIRRVYNRYSLATLRAKPRVWCLTLDQHFWNRAKC